MRKWLTVLLYVSGITLAFIYRYEILEWLRGGHNLFLSVGAATLLALFPVVPYKAVIGLFGYVYGSAYGAAICWIATTLAAAVMYAFIKYLFRDRASVYLSSISALDKFTSAVKRRPFSSIIIARLVPVVPQTAVNVYAGAAGLPFWSYLAASGLGKIPGIALYAFLGGELFQHPRKAIIAILVYAAIIALAGWSFAPRRSGGKSGC